MRTVGKVLGGLFLLVVFVALCGFVFQLYALGQFRGMWTDALAPINRTVNAVVPTATAEATAEPTIAPVQAPMPKTGSSAPAVTVLPTVTLTSTSTATAASDTVTVPTATPEALPPVPAGADFFAVGVEDVDGNWMRLREPTNSRPDSPEYCSWAFQFQASATVGVSAQWSHCIELHITGTGTFTLTVRPDMAGYDTSNISGQGLAWWPTGVGEYSVDGSAFMPLTTGAEGVSFPKDSSARTMVFRLTNGFVTVPLGEIRNQVVPTK